MCQLTEITENVTFLESVDLTVSHERCRGPPRCVDFSKLRMNNLKFAFRRKCL